MDLDRYLARIGYAGPVRTDHTTLFALHRAHVQAIPYENLGIHLGQPLTLDEGQIFTKIVEERRGGWCYEMNGLFAWALRRIGFRVHLLASGIISLRDAVFTEVLANGVDRHTISDAAMYSKVLAEQFDLPIPEAAALWARAWQRHQARLAAE